MMAKVRNPLEELNVTAKKAVEQTTEQTLGVVDNYFNFLPEDNFSISFGRDRFG